MQNELNRAVLNHEVTTLLATDVYNDLGVDKKTRRLWMKVNPSLGTMTFTVTGQDGQWACETLSLEKAIDVYNDLGKECVA